MAKENAMEGWCRLVRERKWSTRQKLKLIEKFKEPELIFNASSASVQACFLRKPKNNVPIVKARDVERDMHWLSQPNHHLVDFSSSHYPPRLKEIHDPPLALFAIGDVRLLDDPSVSIVGSRRPTPVGLKVTSSIATHLAQLGLVVTSGLALGIDGAAHKAALQGRGSSIAVMGGGLDRVYPARHRKLYEQLSCEGLVLSEYPLGFAANRSTFPQRNRIVSGVSLGVVIVEAALRSGTLITARLAAEQGRDVMVVPGPATSASYQGSNRLIQQGAALVQDATDVLECLAGELQLSIPESPPNSKSASDTQENESKSDCHNLLHFISATSTSVDDIIFASGLTAAKVSSMLITLELEGAIAVNADGGYVNLS